MEYLDNTLCLFKRFRPATTCSTTVSQPPSKPSTTAEPDPVTYSAKHPSNPPNSREYKLEVNYLQLSHEASPVLDCSPWYLFQFSHRAI